MDGPTDGLTDRQAGRRTETDVQLDRQTVRYMSDRMIKRQAEIKKERMNE